MADKIIIDIAVQGDAEVRLKKIGEEAEKAGEKAKKSFLDAGRIFDNFLANIASNAVSSAFSAFGSALSTAVGFLTDAVKESAEAEENVNQLRIALKSAGVQSEQSAQAFLDFAGAIQNTTKYSDDAVLSAGALLEQIAKLDEEGLEQATTAALNMSAALGIELTQAATLVGKAANGEVGALKRYGIVVKEGADVAETFANALDTLNSKFGGAAAAQVNTFAGSQAKLKNQFGELQEAIGNLITSNPVLIKLQNEVAGAFQELTKWVTDNRDAISAFVSQGLIALVDGLGISVTIVQAMSVTMLKLARDFVGVVGVLEAGASKVTFGLAFKEQAEAAAAAYVDLDNRVRATEGSPVFDKLRDKLTEISMKLQEVAAVSANGAVRGVEATTQGIDTVISKEGQLTEAQQAEAEKREAQRLKEITDEIDQLVAANELMLAEDKYRNETRIAENERTAIALASGEDKLSNKVLDLKKKQVQREKDYDKERLKAAEDALSALATLQTTKSKELQAVGKAAAIAKATMDTYQGATAAASSLAGIPIVGPALGAAAAAAFIVAGLANVAKIAGVDLATGITEVPAGYPNDTFSANLTSGERVVDVDTNKDLKNFLSGTSGMTALLAQINEKMDRLAQHVIVNIGNKTIVDELRDGLLGGRALNV